MSVSDLIRRVISEWNKRDKESFLTYFTEKSEIAGPAGLVLRGVAGAETFWDVWQTAFPDNHSTISTVFSTGEHGCREAILTGTHTGVLQYLDGSRIPPTGRSIRVHSTEVYIACDGKIDSLHIYFDQVELLTQLGLMPTHQAQVG